MEKNYCPIIHKIQYMDLSCGNSMKLSREISIALSREISIDVGKKIGIDFTIEISIDVSIREISMGCHLLVKIDKYEQVIGGFLGQ